MEVSKEPPTMAKDLKRLIEHLSNGDASFVEILVGAERKKFLIHKSLICSTSTYFSATFQGKFLEGQNQTLVLDDVDSETFGYIATYMYTGTLHDLCVPEEGLLPYECVRIWIAAGRFLMTSLQNHMIGEIHEWIDYGETEDLVAMYRLVFENEIDVLMKLCVDMFLDQRTWMLMDGLKHLPEQMLKRVLDELPKKGKYVKEEGSTSFVRNLEDYYVGVSNSKERRR